MAASFFTTPTQQRADTIRRRLVKSVAGWYEGRDVDGVLWRARRSGSRRQQWYVERERQAGGLWYEAVAIDAASLTDACWIIAEHTSF